jgi:hypothetical protein
MGNQTVYIIYDSPFTKMVQWPSNIAKYYTGNISSFSTANWDTYTLQAPGKYLLKPTPPMPTPAPTPIGGRCDPSCKNVTNPFMANNTYGVCSYDKNNGYTCLPCPTYGNDGIDCDQFQKCSGCPPSMTSNFPIGWQPTKPSRKHNKRGGGGGDQCGGIDGICYEGDGGGGGDGSLYGGDNVGGDNSGDNGGWYSGGSGGGGYGGDRYRKRDRGGKDRHHQRGWASYGPYGRDDGGGIYSSDGTGGYNGGDPRYGNHHNVRRSWRRDEHHKYQTNYGNGNGGGGGGGGGNNDSESCKQGTNFIKRFLSKFMNGGGGGGDGSGGYGGVVKPVPYMDYIKF